MQWILQHPLTVHIEATKPKHKLRQVKEKKSYSLRFFHFLHLKVTLRFTNSKREKSKGNFATFQFCLLCSTKHKLTFMTNSRNEILVTHITGMMNSSIPPGNDFFVVWILYPFWEVAMGEFITFQFGVFHHHGEKQRCLITSLSCEGSMQTEKKY